MDKYGDINYGRVDMRILGKYLGEVSDHYFGILKRSLIEYWPPQLRRWMKAELNIIDPKEYWHLSNDELVDHGAMSLKYICQWYGRRAISNGQVINGLVNAKLASKEYQLLKPKLLRASYHVNHLDKLDDVNKRINIFWGGVSRSSFAGYTEISKVLKIILVEANETDGNERCNYSRKKLVNEHGLINLDKISDVIDVSIVL